MAGKKHKVIITSDQSYVMQSPMPGTNIISPVSVGRILASDVEAKGYYPVYFPDGRKGFVPASNAMDLMQWKNNNHRHFPLMQSSSQHMTFLGRPYLWGHFSEWNGLQWIY